MIQQTDGTPGQKGFTAKKHDSRRRGPVLAACGIMAITALTSPPAAAASTAADDGPVVVIPGAPGEGNDSSGSDDWQDDQDSGDTWNQADAAFMTMMIPHHAQAVEMTALVDERAHSKQLTRFAERMHLAQEAEIDAMGDWLAERDLPVPEGAGDELMPGMLTDGEMETLRAAEGKEFDRLFLEGMIDHHEGALDMCDAAQAEGIDLDAQQMVTHIASSQAGEISRMEDLLKKY